MISWLIGQAAWAWAKAGIWESEYAEAYAYPNEDEGMHEDYHENDEKPPVDAKDEKLFDQKVLINRTRPEACDQEVKTTEKVLIMQGAPRDAISSDMSDKFFIQSFDKRGGQFIAIIWKFSSNGVIPNKEIFE